MSEKKWPDWSEFLKKGKVETVNAREQLLKSLQLQDGDVSQKGGERVIREQLLKEAIDIIRNAHSNKTFRQATDEELFGRLVVSEEDLKKIEEEYKNKIADFYKAAQAPVGDGPTVNDDDWGNGKSYEEQMELTEEERAERNMHVEGE